MIVLDASVLIAHLEARDPHHARAVELLRTAAKAEWLLIASAMTVAEVLVGAIRAGALPVAQRALAQLGVAPVGFVGDDTAVRLATLRAETGLKMPDCCVLLAAEDHDADVVLTFDAKLEGAARRAGYATTLDGVTP